MPSAFGKPVITANRFGVPAAAAVAQTMTLVTTLTASASASLSYTSFASSSYKSYKLIFNRILSTDNGVPFYVQASVDGGTNYGSLWTGQAVYVNNSTLWAVTTTSAVQNFTLAFNCGNNANYGGVYGELMLNYSPVAGTSPGLTGVIGAYNNSTNNAGPSSVHGVYNNATEVNALKFLFSALTIASGTIKIYGIT